MSGRPWLPHDGIGCPVPVGTMIETWRLDGERRSGIVRPEFHSVFIPQYGFNQWFWAVSGRPEIYCATDVIAYRLSDTDDKAKREARMAEFTRIAEEGLKTDRPVKSPQKVGAEQ